MNLFRRTDFNVAGKKPAGIDYRIFVATLQAHQLATATARAQARCGRGASDGHFHQGEPLSGILLGCEDWQEAVLVQGGSFNPAFARVIDAR